MDLDTVKTLGILGDRNMGKSSIMMDLIRTYKGDREVVFYGYPELVKNEKTGRNFKRIYTLAEMELTTDSILILDELQRHIKFYQRRTSDEFLEILSTMSHNNNTLILQLQCRSS